MINKPGTLLVVRRLQRYPKDKWSGSPKNGIFGVFRLDEGEPPTGEVKSPGYANDRFWISPVVDLPLGAVVMLLSLEKESLSPSEQRLVRFPNKMCIRVLYGEKRLVGYLSNNQINKWFTFPHVWKMRKKQEDEQKEIPTKSTT